jgi:hypothetical protein
MMRRVLSEDLSGLPDFTTHPAEVEISTFASRPVSDLAPDAIPRDILNDIARAIVDHGWRYGVRECQITMRREYRTVNGRRVGVTRMVGRMTYA